MGYTLRTHPDGALYVGDVVSFEVIAPPGADPEDDSVLITFPVGDENPSQTSTLSFENFGLGGRSQATWIWAWNTSYLQPGEYPVTLSLEPSGSVWTETVTLLPEASLPPVERQATWETVTNDCCAINYITHTAAQRDLEEILSIADEQAALATENMGIGFTAPITITLLPRVLGHGGFAGADIHISYLDRDYVTSSLDNVLHHEFIHILDARLGGVFRPDLFVEGLAVYMTGGHFKPEPLLPRAAALLDMSDGQNWYIPLEQLADNFYPSQHEIGYLEGGALIQYMVERWGWEEFNQFYRHIPWLPTLSQSEMIDQALQSNFGITIVELEGQFLEFLRHQTVTPAIREDLRLTVRLFDAIRRYQLALDPSAYFETAWIVDTAEMRRRGITADYLRHPATDENLALETMLSAAGESWLAGDIDQAWALIEAINTTLDALERGEAQPFEADELAQKYLAIVALLREGGYEPQRILLAGDGSARVWATTGDTELVELKLEASK